MSRYIPFLLILALAAFFGLLWLGGRPAHVWPFAVFGFFVLVGVHDLIQKRHTVLRNYPMIGHMRWILEAFGPELRQYFFASDTAEEPFNRVERSLVYQRAKDVEDKLPFGTRLDVYKENYAWLNHSIKPAEVSEEACRVVIGPRCKKPYSASLLNISAMSFGALSGRAIQAMNRGARMGGFAHDTGEGSISRYHAIEGGDLIWEIGTGYFGARRKDGTFCPETFAEKASADQVRMVEIKLSQGAKPGHGGILPGAKVTAEIAEARGVPVGREVISPRRHSAFSTPIEMMEFVASLRDLSGGKPAGFKLCVGHRWEFMAIVKAMIKTGIYPDFIVIDGAEGGTGAAPQEFSNHIGTPLLEGLSFVRNTLIGAGIRNKVRLAGSGKIIGAFDMVKILSLGADYCNAARAFMFSAGCIQSLRCHTNKCPTGVATQDPLRQRAINIEDKAQRVYNFHRNTIGALREVLAASGLEGPAGLRPDFFYVRDGDSKAHSAAVRALWLEDGELLSGTRHPEYAAAWKMARPDSFTPRPL